GAFLAAAAISPDGELGAGMLATGAGIAWGSHALKAASRALLNTSPEPVSHWPASLGEDAVPVSARAPVFAGPWLALAMVLTASALVAAGMWWLLRWLRRSGRSRG